MLTGWHSSTKPWLLAFAPRRPMGGLLIWTWLGMTIATTVKTPIAVPTEMFVLTMPLASVTPLGLTDVPVGGEVIEKVTRTPGAGLLLESTSRKVTVACSLKPDPRNPMIVQLTPPHLVETQLIACTLTIGKGMEASEPEGAWVATMVAVPAVPVSRNTTVAFPSLPVVALTELGEPPSGNENPPRLVLNAIV